MVISDLWWIFAEDTVSYHYLNREYTHTLFRCGKFQSQNVWGAAAELALGSAAVAALTLDARPR